MELAGLFPFPSKEITKENAEEFYRLLESVAEIPADSKIGKRADKYLDSLMASPNEVTQVTYDAEVLRKRDRTEEAVIATIGIRNKQIEMDRQLVQWSRFTGWYSDIIEEGASENAIVDSGIKWVRWVTAKDDKVCGECEDLEGRVFKSTEVPEKPHRNCRCHVTPVRR